MIASSARKGQRCSGKVIAAGRPSAVNQECFAAVVRSEILDDIRRKDWAKVKEMIRRLTGVEMEVEPR